MRPYMRQMQQMIPATMADHYARLPPSMRR
jgi:hypothetical protein